MVEVLQYSLEISQVIIKVPCSSYVIRRPHMQQYDEIKKDTQVAYSKLKLL